MLKAILKKREDRRDAIAKARKAFVSFRLVSESPGWKIYEDAIVKKMDIIRNQMETKDDLSGEDLKRLQLALKIYKQIQLIPKNLKEKAMKGIDK